MIKLTKKTFLYYFVGITLPSLLIVNGEVLAQSEVERLQKTIDEHNSRLTDIDAEILRYQSDLADVGAERQTLEREVNRLELERKKINAEINRTDSQINSTDLEISRLTLEVKNTENSIAVSEQAIGAIIRKQYRAGEESLVEVLLRHDRLSDFLREVDTSTQVQTDMAHHVADLGKLKIDLEEQQVSSQEKRIELASLKNQYTDQNTILINNKAEQSELLSATKNEEANFQSLLASREAARDQLISEVREFESQLQFILDPNSVPTPGTQVFNWPVKNPIITQFFGGTEFARRNPGIYGGRAYHPGVDFGTPRGTPIYAPLSGTVRATGNTDAVPGCYSWGKWSLIDHANGLSTLYAHLDVISALPGQKVTTGEIIGYTGNTGISTGPHLHFTVYAQEAVSIRRFNEIKTVTGCGAATTPTAATDAYLDPMLYLPAYN